MIIGRALLPSTVVSPSACSSPIAFVVDTASPFLKRGQRCIPIFAATKERLVVDEANFVHPFDLAIFIAAEVWCLGNPEYVVERDMFIVELTGDWELFRHGEPFGFEVPRYAFNIIGKPVRASRLIPSRLLTQFL